MAVPATPAAADFKKVCRFCSTGDAPEKAARLRLRASGAAAWYTIVILGSILLEKGRDDKGFLEKAGWRVAKVYALTALEFC
jgi:hypothetical protein